MQRQYKIILFILLAIVGLIVTFSFPAIPQNPHYHDFADQRRLLMIPNFWNVVSNIPFGIVGLMGICFLFSPKAKLGKHFIHPGERDNYLVLFIGIFLVMFGSSYYHWNPNDATLVWDRLPMSVGFMALFAAMISERISLNAGRYLLVPFVLVGLFSVIYWGYTQALGHGDLRLYIYVQFYTLIALALLLVLFKSPYTHTRLLVWALAWYVIAKVFEMTDKPVYQLTHHIISGHTLKHLTAAFATYLIYRYVSRRQIKQ